MIENHHVKATAKGARKPPCEAMFLLLVNQQAGERGQRMRYRLSIRGPFGTPARVICDKISGKSKNPAGEGS